MKTHQLILLTTVLFITLFYGEDMGLNFGILGIAYALLTLFNTPEANRTRTFLILFVLGILSSVAFAWYGDFVSFLAVFTSLFLLAFKSRNRDLKSLFVIPVFAVSFITFIYRVFKFDQWLPKRNTPAALKKLISVILIPAFFILAFFGIYSLGSAHFSNIFTGWEFDLQVWEFIVLSGLGFFIAFNFWNFKIENFIFNWNHHLKNDFLNEDRIQKPTYSFLDLSSERRSGVISLLALNVLLLVFIITFNYEQFVEIPKTPNQLSAETHDRVNAVILSIIMAVLVIMFYFKGTFNFDEKAKPLKLFAKIWIFLNAVLVISAVAKNSEYIINFGLTYKRLGVYAFLILSLIGLALTFLKIKNRQTNAYLFNHMIWYFYGTVLAASFINWGNLATFYNISNSKGNFEFLQTLNYNDELLQEHFPEKMKNGKYIYPEYKSRESFLSKIIYYETLK
ncbi:MAG: DUF4173 domain-containing protein [Kaistella sp.]|nr:DUF4173 domain-containing protein [Kaistella sp.]